MINISVVLVAMVVIWFDGRRTGYRKGYVEGFRQGTSYLKAAARIEQEPLKKVWRGPNGL